ncbi:hypothetical protein K437DRAFT_294582 [Tilletiaria anomala UBC 951]|uniref:H/ACA ribonucleoprotein complex non-core subunit NAF1 n=1 Tax=Tilletiaria anomala (strain ATCC 24038 / CBS 436.72 / UBC 951) TaxID=1037660 RepID=A0A066W2H6_TILAU|nr:uncharacterized protein K437DRAFT_294582 [Tilletiaria anomala UBC 951]KDN45279.1 hypothetical protein K437DRAFT_294582 [Tilletiaria anomala UBC 951]
MVGSPPPAPSTSAEQPPRQPNTNLQDAGWTDAFHSSDERSTTVPQSEMQTKSPEGRDVASGFGEIELQSAAQEEIWTAKTQVQTEPQQSEEPEISGPTTRNSEAGAADVQLPSLSASQLLNNLPQAPSQPTVADLGLVTHSVPATSVPSASENQNQEVSLQSTVLPSTEPRVQMRDIAKREPTLQELRKRVQDAMLTKAATAQTRMGSSEAIVKAKEGANGNIGEAENAQEQTTPSAPASPTSIDLAPSKSNAISNGDVQAIAKTTLPIKPALTEKQISFEWGALATGTSPRPGIAAMPDATHAIASRLWGNNPKKMGGIAVTTDPEKLHQAKMEVKLEIQQRQQQQQSQLSEEERTKANGAPDRSAGAEKVKDASKLDTMEEKHVDAESISPTATAPVVQSLPVASRKSSDAAWQQVEAGEAGPNAPAPNEAFSFVGPPGEETAGIAEAKQAGEAEDTTEGQGEVGALSKSYPSEAGFDSDSDSSSSDDSSSSSESDSSSDASYKRTKAIISQMLEEDDGEDDDEEGSGRPGAGGKGGYGPTTKNETPISAAVGAANSLPFKQVPAELKGEIKYIGVVHSVVDGSVCVIEQDLQRGGGAVTAPEQQQPQPWQQETGGYAQAYSNNGHQAPPPHTQGQVKEVYAVLDTGSVLCLEDGKVLGSVFETFGSVQQPFYSLLLPPVQPAPDNVNTAAAMQPLAVPTKGLKVYYLPSHSTYVLTRMLKLLPKGSDASNVFDEEIGDEEREFSDDEEEVRWKQQKKADRAGGAGAKKGGKTRGSGEDDVGARNAKRLRPNNAPDALVDGYHQHPRPICIGGPAPQRRAPLPYEDAGNADIGAPVLQHNQQNPPPNSHAGPSSQAPHDGSSQRGRGRGRGRGMHVADSVRGRPTYAAPNTLRSPQQQQQFGTVPYTHGQPPSDQRQHIPLSFHGAPGNHSPGHGQGQGHVNTMFAYQMQLQMQIQQQMGMMQQAQGQGSGVDLQEQQYAAAAAAAALIQQQQQQQYMMNPTAYSYAAQGQQGYMAHPPFRGGPSNHRGHPPHPDNNGETYNYQNYNAGGQYPR